jgi:myo-inositol-1(or 4)-monophosphatase
MRSRQTDVELLKDAALEAGALAMRFFRRNPRTWEKAGGSPVTEADVALDDLLRKRLLAARPDYGWLSEETVDDLSRRERSTIFVVDPIDGTRGFIEGGDSWCVSLAVVEEGRPVAAALNAPARGEVYLATRGGGAWIGDRRLAVSDRSELSGARLAGPRGWLRTEAVKRLGADLKPHIPSLAYRFAEVAADRLDAAFASPRSHDWDLAASDLLVHEAGGRLTRLDGTPPLYNEAVPRHGVLAAANAVLLPHVLASVADAEREVTRGAKGLSSSRSRG